MALNSFSFIFYLFAIIIVITLLQVLKKTRNKEIYSNLQKAFLLIVSYLYLYLYDFRFCICLLVVTIFTFILALIIEKNTKHNKSLITIGIVALVCFLGYFKYSNFFINNVRLLAGKESITLNIILPIGISFYIFTTIAYLIDVYRGTYSAEKNIIDFSLFVSFFPKLVAGPIIRGKEFIPQLKNYKGISLKSFNDGIQIFVFGLFKKIVLADHLGVFVDDVFNAPNAFNTFTIILAVLSYSMQIYFDFSGYSDMAIGVSKILGFDFSANFNLPYISKNFSEFWKRWHISLSSWFQDYLYIPLGGNRKGEFRTYFNLIIVMLISGLWHGAGWNYIIWGLLYGIGNCVIRYSKKKQKNRDKRSTIMDRLSIAVTFIFVTIFWVTFRAENINNAMEVYKQLFTIHSGINQPYTWSFFAFAILIVSTIIAIIKSKKNNEERVNGFYPILNLKKTSSLIIFFTLIGLTIILGYFGNTAFIYGKF